MTGAGTKLVGLAAAAALLSFAPGLLSAVVIVAAVAVAWNLANIPWPRLGRALAPLIWFLIPIGLVQFWAAGGSAAMTTMASIVALVSAAAWVSETTRTSDLLVFISRVTGSRTLGFAIAFLIRLVPMVATMAREVDAARRARGAGRNPLALLSPLLIRVLKASDVIADALDARGFKNRVVP